MFNGAHIVIYSKNAEADRAFFRDVLGFRHVDAGHGWLIFALPPSEAAFHPAEESTAHELYLLCDDIEKTVASLNAKGVETSEISEQRWGCLSGFTLPGGARVAFYQPLHERAR